MDFPQAYRHCKKTQALHRGSEAVITSLRSINSTEWFEVEEVTLQSFGQIKGYRVTTLDGVAFFPDLSSIPSTGGLSSLRDAFTSVDIVIPPRYSLGYLMAYSQQIKSAADEDAKMAIAEDMLREMYDPRSMSVLIVDSWRRLSAFEPYIDQIIEAAKAHLAKLNGVAIVGLLPCIEGIVRKMGLSTGLVVDASVDIQSLLKVFKRLKKKELDRLIEGYDWYPDKELNVNLLDRFDERVQIYTHIEMYFESKLYLHTERAAANVTLNRHGITHGLFDGYATDTNFYRLFNLLNVLSLPAVMAQGSGSLFFPNASPEALDLTNKLMYYRNAGAWAT